MPTPRGSLPRCLLRTCGRGKWNLEYEALRLRSHLRFRDARTTKPIATYIGIRINYVPLCILRPRPQMSYGISEVRCESNFNIKCAAHACIRECRPMCALNGIGKFPVWRLTLLGIGTRVVPELRLAHVFDHLHMTGAIGPRIRF
jgi:hypothetical protein